MAMMTTANFLDIADTPITQPISNRYISVILLIVLGPGRNKNDIGEK